MKIVNDPAGDKKEGQYEVGNKVDETQISATTNLNQNENADSSPLNSRFNVEEPYEDLVASLTDDMLEKLYHVYCCDSDGLFHFYGDLATWEEDKRIGYNEFNRTEDIVRYVRHIDKQEPKLRNLICHNKSDEIWGQLVWNLRNDYTKRQEFYELVEDRYERIAS